MGRADGIFPALRRHAWRTVLVGGCALLAAVHAAAYSLIGPRWAIPAINMHLQVGAPASPLLDGFTSWTASAEDALLMWNNQIGATRFVPLRDSTASRSEANGLNNVFFSADIYGDAFGSGVLAVTLTYTSGGSQRETDVLFNNRINWNSYRGPLRFGSGGAPVYDFHRVALHEFGHALGLDHPDEAGQSISALMNSRITSLDTLTSDDIEGARAMYGPPRTTAPAITAHPQSRTVNAGQPVTFSVEATSTVTPAYQWLRNNAALAGATSSTFTIGSTSPGDAGTYSVVISNGAGAVTSNGATLTVNTTSTPTTPVTGPVVTTQPSSQTVAAGANVTFAVGVTGTAPLAYQWRWNGAAISGATAATLQLTSVHVSAAGTYTVMVSNPAGSALSQNATLTVNGAPSITTHPTGQTLNAGERLSLSVSATGPGALSYQWQKDGGALTGGDGATLTIAAVQANDAGTYRAIVSNEHGAVTTAAAVVAVRVPPRIAAAPADRTAAAGTSVTFSTEATAYPPPTYQWFKDGIAIGGATTATYTISAVGTADAGAYAVRITNALGSIMSPAANLTVTYSRLVNISTRGLVPAGGALTAGFHLRGAGAKSVLIRAIGPTLADFGIGSALEKVRLDVIPQGAAAPLASSQAWAATEQLLASFVRVGAFPLRTGSNDSALETQLEARGYSARLSAPESGMSGISLAEVYDADPLQAGARLVNVSTLGHAGAGEHALTAGFVIQGTAPKRLLIRAIGPSLAAFGVNASLVDPQLAVVALGQTTPLATNDDWGNAPELWSAFLATGAFTLATDSKDAAVVVTLAPGAYTVSVTGVGGSTGQALVELYDLDP